MFAVITCFGFMTTPTAEAASGFYVSGTSIYDASGNKFVMRGVNIAHAWYTEKTETSIKGAANNGANTVRVVLANGSKYTKTSAQEVKNIIGWCKSNKLICILEVHDATGSDSTYDLNKCVDYWKEMKNVLSGTEKYVIVNIANEWCGHGTKVHGLIFTVCYPICKKRRHYKYAYGRLRRLGTVS